MQDQVPNQDEPGRNEAGLEFGRDRFACSVGPAEAGLRRPDQEFDARSRRQPRLRAVPRLPLATRGVRALPRRHGPLPHLGMAAVARRRAFVGNGHHGPWRPGADAGSRRARVPRDLRRGLAQEVRARGDLSRPLRQRDRQPRHQAQPFGPARRAARSPDQGGARHRGPPLLRAFRHRRARHVPRRSHQCEGRRRRPGRLLDHPAARQEPVPEQRAHHRAQDQGGLPRPLAGEPLTKNEILKLYLDRAYMGGGAFGVDAAANFYFGKSVREVESLPKRRCSPACSRRRPSSRPTSTCRRRAAAPTSCSTIWSRPAS